VNFDKITIPLRFRIADIVSVQGDRVLWPM
jgi:hypothetical protein